MDINSILAFALPISAILVFVIVGMRLLGWAWSSVFDAVIVPEKTRVVKGSLKHGIMHCADSGLKMARSAKASVKAMLKSKVKAEDKAAPTIIEYRILGKHKGSK